MGKEDMRYIQTQTHTQIYTIYIHTMGFSSGLVIKNTSVNARDMSLIPGLGRSPGEGNGNPLHYFCPGNPHGQRSLAGYSPWGCKIVGHNLVTKQQNNNLHDGVHGQ